MVAFDEGCCCYENPALYLSPVCNSPKHLHPPSCLDERAKRLRVSSSGKPSLAQTALCNCWGANDPVCSSQGLSRPASHFWGLPPKQALRLVFCAWVVGHNDPGRRNWGHSWCPQSKAKCCSCRGRIREGPDPAQAPLVCRAQVLNLWSPGVSQPISCFVLEVPKSIKLEPRRVLQWQGKMTPV